MSSEEYNSYPNEETVHFTYKANADMTMLCQGDVLVKTNELQEI